MEQNPNNFLDPSNFISPLSDTAPDSFIYSSGQKFDAQTAQFHAVQQQKQADIERVSKKIGYNYMKDMAVTGQNLYNIADFLANTVHDNVKNMFDPNNKDMYLFGQRMEELDKQNGLSLTESFAKRNYYSQLYKKIQAHPNGQSALLNNIKKKVTEQ